MADIKLYNTKLEEAGTVPSPVSLDSEVIKTPVVHQLVKASLAAKRQGTACTKNRALVRGGGAKPFKQKGTGRARQGSSRSPLMVGGGTAFGPTPRDYTQKINKKMALKGIQSILADKNQAGKLIIVESMESTGKTKEMASLLTGKEMLNSYLITDSNESLALRAIRNLQWAKGASVDGFSVYDAVKHENLIIEKAAFEKLMARLG